MKVTQIVAKTLAGLGVDHVFGVVGSGNFYVTNALVSEGARFVAARHEHGACMMAVGFTHVTHRVSAASLHQGCGVTNAMTAIAEAAKSRVPIVILAAETSPSDRLSNFWIEQQAALLAVGAVVERVSSAKSAARDAARAFHRARLDRRAVVLSLPLDVQAEEERVRTLPPDLKSSHAIEADPTVLDEMVAALRRAVRPIILAGKGAVGARQELDHLAHACGAVLATSVPARGLFAGNPWSIDVAGGFGTPLSVELFSDADLVVAFGASLNRWTTRNGALLDGSAVVQVDVDPAALACHAPADLTVVGDAANVAEAVATRLEGLDGVPLGFRTPEVREQLASRGSWRQVPFDDTSGDGLIDPRTLTIALDDVLPTSRVVVPDAGNFSRYPSTFLAVESPEDFCFPLAFQSVGMSLGTAVGAAVGSPGQVVVAAVGDGGLMMSLTELDTAVRECLPLVVLVYNDAAYGAEVHKFGPEGCDLQTVTFPDTDIAALARGFGIEAGTVRRLKDLDGLRSWLMGDRDRPYLLDAKITRFPSWLPSGVSLA